VLVIMRKNQVAEILPVLAANQQTPNVLFLVNNAAGSGEWVKALGRERVLLGFVGAGGAREGHVVRYSLTANQETTFGELDGQTTPRLEQLDAALKSAGFETDICSNMDAWLKTHVALVSPIANALYAAGGDNYRLARTPDALLLLIRALREGLQTLRALGISVTPSPYRLLAALPEPLLLVFLCRLLATQRSELLLARHANAARDEMQILADEFQTLVREAGISAPAINQLNQYLDPTVPAIPEGSQQMQPRWQELWPVALAVGILIGFVAVLRSPGKQS
jgi:2-dehydropantoate 2-reductase